MSRTASSPRLLFFPLCLLTLTLAVQPAAAMAHHAPRQVREQIDDLEEQWRTATINGDVAVMDRLLSDDYVGITWTGQVNTKSSQLDRIRNRTMVITRLTLSDLKVKLLGSVAIVTCRATAEGSNDGAPITGDYRYTRVYQRLPSGWKITNFEATRIPNHHRDPATPTP